MNKNETKPSKNLKLELHEGDDYLRLLDNEGETVGDVYELGPTSRIVCCVNFCSGLTGPEIQEAISNYRAEQGWIDVKNDWIDDE